MLKHVYQCEQCETDTHTHTQIQITSILESNANNKQLQQQQLTTPTFQKLVQYKFKVEFVNRLIDNSDYNRMSREIYLLLL